MSKAEFLTDEFSLPVDNIDKTLYYYALTLTYENTNQLVEYKLPEDFSFVFYKKGDIKDWVNIHISSKEFSNYKKGIEYFHSFFDSFKEELGKRCLFVVDNKTKEKIATAIISKLTKDEYGYEAAVDFVAIKKEYQGRNLSKSLISRIIKLANELGYNKIILHTQTHTWLVVKICLDMGFEPLILNNDYRGWQIIKTITNHEKLNFVNSISVDKIYSKTARRIYKKLKSMYDTDFNYTIWYKNNLNLVYVLEKEEHIFKYYKGFDDVYLEELKE